MSLLAASVVAGAVGAVVGGGPPPDSVVTIRCHGRLHETRATGFFVAPGGLVATALHAVTGNEPRDVPRSVDVVTADGRVHRVTALAGMDVSQDLCLLRVDYRNAEWLRLAGRVRHRDRVTVLADPRRRGQTDLPVVVTSLRVDEAGNPRYGVDVALTGRSGSPVVDAEGRVVGLVSTTHELAPAGGIGSLVRLGRPVDLAGAHAASAASPWGLVDFAYRAYRAGRTPLAMEYLREAVSLEPPLAAAHNMLGVLLRRDGQVEEAEAEYLEAIRILPDDLVALYNLGLLRADFRLHDRAREAARAAALKEALRLREERAAERSGRTGRLPLRAPIRASLVPTDVPGSLAAALFLAALGLAVFSAVRPARPPDRRPPPRVRPPRRPGFAPRVRRSRATDSGTPPR